MVDLAQSLKEQVNFHENFKNWYQLIVREFGFNPEKDCEARDYLLKILKKKKPNWSIEQVLNSFKSHVEKKKNIFMYGCGPSLEKTFYHILKVKGRSFFMNQINLVADGASRIFMENSIDMDGIFSDLDGITLKEFNKARYMIVHAHGDNIDKLRFFRNKIIDFDNLIGTTQVEPLEDILNPGGFTDGDRILFFIRSFLKEEHEIYFIGMDLIKKVGRYSKPGNDKNYKASPIKYKKIKLAFKLIEWISEIIPNKIHFLNCNVGDHNFDVLSLEEISVLDI